MVGVTGADVDSLRFQQVLRGYRASEVDWALARLGAEIDSLRAQLSDNGTARTAQHHGGPPVPSGPLFAPRSEPS